MWTVRIDGNATVTCRTPAAAQTAYRMAQHWKRQGHDVALYQSGKRILPVRPWASKDTNMEMNNATPKWHTRAACRTLGDADAIFFPHQKDQDQFGATPAQPYCGTCPVAYDCLKAALDGNEFGTWGGMTHTERRILKDRIKKEHFEISSTEDLRHFLEVILPQCNDCGQHRKHKENGRCAACHRAYVKKEELRLKNYCSEGDGLRVHAKGLCSRHYHIALRLKKRKGVAA